jgi:hypothetical protein
MVETVCRNLVFADMHNAHELKQDAIKFIANYSNQVIHTEGWSDMARNHPSLVTEIVAAMSNENSSRNSSSQLQISTSSSDQPLAKRSRLDDHIVRPPY